MRDKDHGDDSNTFDEVISDINSKKQLDAMKSKIDSIHSNQVWTLVDLSEGIVSIECKWIYKKKIGVNDKVETYKARLVIKGYSQCEGINYQKVFSPIVMLKSIHTLLIVVAYYDYKNLADRCKNYFFEWISCGRYLYGAVFEFHIK